MFGFVLLLPHSPAFESFCQQYTTSVRHEQPQNHFSFFFKTDID